RDAADGEAAAVDHDGAAGRLALAVKQVGGVGVADAEREVIGAPGVEEADPVEALGDLAVALAPLGPEHAAAAADREAPHQDVRVARAGGGGPQLGDALELEAADEQVARGPGRAGGAEAALDEVVLLLERGLDPGEAA